VTREPHAGGVVEIAVFLHEPAKLGLEFQFLRAGAAEKLRDAHRGQPGPPQSIGKILPHDLVFAVGAVSSVGPVREHRADLAVTAA
jgi:hypothetical protein